ncbi:MAG: MFS transporter [Streptosporangiaceae bacterium]
MRQSPPPARRLGRRFALLWAGQSASLLGDQITLIALPLLAVGYCRAGTFDVGLLGMCLRLPFLLIGLPAGVWVSRFGLNRSMVLADIARGLAIGLLPAAALAGLPSLAVLFAAALTVGVGTVFFQVSYQSLVPELIPDQARWHAANTRLSLSESMSLLLGPALGGVVVGWCAPPGALFADTGTFVASVATLLLLARSRAARPAGAPCRQQPSLRRQIADGLLYVRHIPVLNSIMWTGAAYNIGAAMYDSMLVLFGVHVLGLSPARLGIAVGIGAIGFPLGSMLSGQVNARLGMGRALIAAAVPSVGGLLVAACATGRAAALVLAAGTMLVGLGQGCFAVNAITLRQLASSADMRARATSVHRFVSWGALPVGSLLAGLIGQAWGIRTAMITAGLISATCAWPLLGSPLRRRDCAGS